MESFLRFVAWINAQGFSTPFLIVLALSSIVGLLTAPTLSVMVGISALVGIVCEALWGCGIVGYAAMLIILLIGLVASKKGG